MIHFTCDGCGKPIDQQREVRYVVRMEVYAALDASDDDVDEDRDHLQEIQDILERMDEAEDDLIGDDVYKQVRFDLCSECQKRVLKSPLSALQPKQLNFSKN